MKKKILISLLLVIAILTTIFDTVYATDEQTEIPTKYDLRNDINIKVENQGNTGWCGVYAEVKMIETYLLKTKNIDYDLSEGYLGNGTLFNEVFGNHVLESDFPTKEYQLTEANQKKFDEATSKAVIKNLEYETSINKDRETIKKYIMNYGSVFASISCDRQWDNYKGGIYHENKLVDFRDFHGVVIIGWDDNYSKDNFYYEKPENDGAWLVLNSWGSNWGNNGTAWVSYEDCNDLTVSCYGIKNLTLSTGEIIETKLTDEKQEEQTTETPITEQETTEPNKTSNIQNIFISVFAVAIILLIIGIILKLKKHK